MPIRLAEIAGIFGLLFILLGWLIPNKDFPWLTVWNEAAALCGTFLLILAAAKKTSRADHWVISWPIGLFLLTAISTVWLQRWTGLLEFAGDAWMVTLYMGAFGIAAITGRRLAESIDTAAWTQALLCIILMGGIFTSGMIFFQWLLATPPVVFLQELTKDSRPYANLGQQNHASTLLFMALCASLQLRRQKCLGTTCTITCLALLSLGMSVTQSRTGLLQGAMLFLWTVGASWRTNNKNELKWGCLAIGFILFFRLSLPWIDQLLLLSQPVRDIINSTTADLRWLVWWTFLDAVALKPWAGYGWLQSALAQEAVAACHPNLRYYFHYTHLLPLDFIIWVGLPLGLTLCGLVFFWHVKHWMAPPMLETGYWIVALTGILIHSLLEYPLAYTYFLLPMGLIMGIIEAKSKIFHSYNITPLIIKIITAGLGAVTLAIAIDVSRAIKIDSQLRFEDLRIGTARISTVPEKMLILDHLGSMYKLRSTNIGETLTEKEIEEIKKGVRRFPFSYNMLRLALILEYHGKHQDSAYWRNLICDMYSPVFCERSANRWAQWENSLPGRFGKFLEEEVESRPKCRRDEGQPHTQPQTRPATLPITPGSSN